MSIPARRIRKVIINGDWYTVKLNSFEIVEMEITDDDGNPIHSEPLDRRAYRFLTDNEDVYYGPLSDITLFKLLDVGD